MILIIDDNRDLAAVFQAILKSRGYDTKSINSAREALKFLRATKSLPELILLDYSMPEMNGQEFMEELLKETPNILDQLKIIGISSYCQDDLGIGEFKKMTSDFSEKPTGIDPLISLVEKHIS